MAKDFEVILNYKFKNNLLKKHAFMHPSYGKTDFEYLEFLGDRVLGLAVSEILYKQHFSSIKKLANTYSKLVSTDYLAKIAIKLELKQHLQCSIETISKKVLADIMEALIGAIYLDSNYETIYKIISDLCLDFEKIDIIDPKMKLQELMQSQGLSIPVYNTISESGKDHIKIYEVEVVTEKGKAVGYGNSKQAASKEAAIAMLKLLKER